LEVLEKQCEGLIGEKGMMEVSVVGGGGSVVMLVLAGWRWQENENLQTEIGIAAEGGQAASSLESE
jgi:hypothetical protein